MGVLTGGAGRAAVVCAALIWALATAGGANAAGWLRAESPHFIVYSSGSEARTRGYTLMLEDFDSLLRAMLLGGAAVEGPLKTKLTVYLVASDREVRVAWPDAPQDVKGFYHATLDETYAIAVRDDGEYEDRTKGDDVVLHEYVHHFMYHYFPGSYPGWLTEGYAEYFATADLADKIKLGDFADFRADSLNFETWMPVAELISKRVSDLPEPRHAAYYAEAWLLTHYLVSDPERLKGLTRYLSDLKPGADPKAAWAAQVGEPQKLDASLKSYMRGRLTGKIIPRTWTPPKVVVTPVPVGEGEVSMIRHVLTRGLSKSQSERTLKTLREVCAKRPDDAAVTLVLAMAESEFGDRKEGDRLIGALLARNPNDAAALRQRAVNLLSPPGEDATPSDNDRMEAARLLTTANKLEPDDYRTLYWYAQSRRFEPGYPTENTYNTMLRAADLAPQVASVRMAAGRMAVARKDSATAREMLEPVAADPHGGQNAKRALELLATLGAAP